MSARQDILDMIEEYTRAEKAVLKGQSYTIGGRSLSRADLSKIIEGRQGWERKLAAYDNRGQGYALASFE